MPHPCYDRGFPAVEYLIKQYGLQQGALEIQYLEEFFLDFPRKKTAAEVINRLSEREHQILMAPEADWEALKVVDGVIRVRLAPGGGELVRFGP